MNGRVIVSILVGLVAVTSAPASATAAQWKVTLAHVSVAPTKPAGNPWDPDSSPPDIAGEFAVGRLREGRCEPRLKEVIAKHQDTFQFASEISIVLDVEASERACFVLSLVDRDLAVHDPIVTGTGILGVGEENHDLGAARIRLSVAVVEGASERLANGSALQAPQLAVPAAPRSALYKVSVVTARISPTKTDGATWDPATDKEAEDARVLHGLLGIGLAFATGGGSALVAASTTALKDSGPMQVSHGAKTVAAPDPRIIVRWGGLVFSTPKSRNTLAPTWDYQFLVPAEIAERKPLRVEVLDVDDGETESIGADSVPGKEAVSSEVFRRKFGSVEELVLEVEKVSEGSVPHEQVVKVDTTRGWTDTGIEVVAGQQVQIKAGGEHCLRGGRCFGPDGDSSIAFETGNHADGMVARIRNGQLSAVIGDEIVGIGASSSFTAHSSGRLRLGVASRASSGALTANVRVFYPLRAGD